MPKQKVFAASFLFLAPSLVLLFYSYIGVFSRFMADDFCSINDARRFKMLRYIWHWYNTWGGRYSAIATDELLIYIGAIGVRFVPFVVLMLCVVGASIMCHKFLQKTVSKDVAVIQSMALGGSLVFAIVSVSPGVQTVLYWWNAMRTYVPPFILLTIHIAYLFWAMDALHARKNIMVGSVFSFLLALFIGGFNETFTTVQFLFFAGLTGFCVMAKKMRFSDTIVPLLFGAMLGCAIALTIMVMSPGAARRLTFFPPHPDVISMLRITLEGYLQYMSGIFSSISKVSALIAMVLVALWIGTESKEKTSQGWSVTQSIVGGILLSFVSLLPSVYGLSKMPAERTFIVPTYVLVLSLGYSAVMMGKQWSGDTNFSASKYIKPGFLLCALILVAYSSWVNARTLYENRGSYSAFSRQWDQIDAMIKQARSNGEESVTLPPLLNWASLDQPNQNPKYWVTACYSEYYGIQVYGPPSQ
jgi:hypothetical protein